MNGVGDGVSLRALALTGLRFGELAALGIGRVDIERRRMAAWSGSTATSHQT
jgi:integrase